MLSVYKIDNHYPIYTNTSINANGKSSLLKATYQANDCLSTSSNHEHKI